jgi:copper chaperone NosL
MEAKFSRDRLISFHRYFIFGPGPGGRYSKACFRAKFSNSRMLVTYDDGSQLGTCSIHCLAVDLALNIDKTPKTIEAGDYNTKNLIDAEKAVWVIGGNKPGVMSKRAKWAFAKKSDAEAFVEAEGGKVATFEDAMKAAYEDMYFDTKMIRERKKMRQMKKGT